MKSPVRAVPGNIFLICNHWHLWAFLFKRPCEKKRAERRLPLGGRKLKQTRRGRLTRTSQNKRFNSQNNDSARRYTCWYISLPLCAQLQRQMTKLEVLCRT